MKGVFESVPAMAKAGGAGELLGDLDGPVAEADRAGTLALAGARWRVGWAVGAADRWHIAAQEAAARSRLVDDMPVTATAMKVPGGDVVLRAAAGRAGAGRVVVLEFTNHTPEPVSLAVAVTGSINAAAARGSRLLVDGRIAVDLGRAPGGTAAVEDGDPWPAVWAEPAPGDRRTRSRAGLAAAAAVVPLAPRVPLRVTVPVEGGSAADGSASEGRVGKTVALEQIASGWRAVVERAASVEPPDDTAVRAWRRGIAASVLAAGGSDPVSAARAAVVLDRAGLPDEADRAREALVAAAEYAVVAPPVATGALRALASRRLRHGRVSGLAELAGPLVEAAGDDLDSLTLEQVAAVLETEAPAAARDARRLLAETRSAPSMPGTATNADGLAAAVRDSLAFGGDGLAGIEALLACLVAESPDHLAMLPVLPEAWKGAAVDARALATRHGTLSFAVRWHGPRPAVLWDLQPRRDEDPVVTLRCGPDDSWATESRAGEALLDTERR